MKNLLVSLLLFFAFAAGAQERLFRFQEAAPNTSRYQWIRLDDIQQAIERDSGATLVLANPLRVFYAFDSIGRIADAGGDFVRLTQTATRYNTSISREVLVNRKYVSRIDSIATDAAQITLRNPSDRITVAGYTALIPQMGQAQPVGYAVFSTLAASDTITLTGTDNLIAPDANKTLLRILLPADPVDGQVCSFAISDTISTVVVASADGDTVTDTAALTAAINGSARTFQWYSQVSAWIRKD
jgi:hypothetical protein